MISATLSRGLREYGVGPKLRALRLKKKMGLVELGRHTGLSAAMISKVERGILFPTLPTLLRIALVFGVGLVQGLLARTVFEQAAHHHKKHGHKHHGQHGAGEHAPDHPGANGPLAGRART